MRVSADQPHDVELDGVLGAADVQIEDLTRGRGEPIGVPGEGRCSIE
jgi:hypothetical protein